jgi:chromosome segregation ATPase
MTDKIDTSLEAVERFSTYNVMMSTESGKYISSADGQWVRYEDYRALSARVAELETERDELEGARILNRNAITRLKARAEAAEQSAATLEERYNLIAMDKINLRGEVATLEAKVAKAARGLEVCRATFKRMEFADDSIAVESIDATLAEIKDTE